MQNFLIQRCSFQQFIAKLILSIFFVLCFYSNAHSQNGSSGNPFTALGQARTVPSAGVYYFNLGGTTFSTYVDANGWVQVIIDFSSTTQAAIPASNALTNSTSGILSTQALATLTSANEARITASGGQVSAITTNDTILSRIVKSRTLHKGGGDNTYNDSWTGTGASYLTIDAGNCNATDLSLANRVFMLPVIPMECIGFRLVELVN